MDLTDDDDTDSLLSKVLGGASLGLGVAMLGSPRLVGRIAGIEDDADTRFWLRAVGVRELVALGVILAAPKSPLPFWFRAAGDAKDLTLLALGPLFFRPSRRG